MEDTDDTIRAATEEKLVTDCQTIGRGGLQGVNGMRACVEKEREHFHNFMLV